MQAVVAVQKTVNSPAYTQPNFAVLVAELFLAAVLPYYSPKREGRLVAVLTSRSITPALFSCDER